MVEPLKEIKTGGEFYSQKINNYLESRVNEIGKDKTFIRSNINLFIDEMFLTILWLH